MSHAYAERLRIETLVPEHAHLMQPLLADARLYPFMDDTRFATVEELAARYRRLAGGSPDPAETWLNCILFVKESEQPIGFVQATVYPDERLADLAYVLGMAYQGQGYATEATRWLIEHLREHHGVERVRAQIDRRNQASVALVRRLGLVLVGPAAESGGDDVYAGSAVSVVCIIAPTGAPHA